MDNHWIYLTERYGAEVENPLEHDLRRAIDQLYVENLPGMTESDYKEHSAAWQRLGHDAGPMYVLTMTRTGDATLEHWHDQDYETEAAKPIQVEALTYQDAWPLWSEFASGNVEFVRTRLLALSRSSQA